MIMAEDLNEAIELLGLPKAVVVGVSQGGMISEWLAMYEGLGHGLYEEAPDFLERIMDFCR